MTRWRRASENGKGDCGGDEKRKRPRLGVGDTIHSAVGLSLAGSVGPGVARFGLLAVPVKGGAVGYLKRRGPILVAILVAILVTALMAPAGETWSESPISPPPTPEQWELDLEEERYEREHPQPTPKAPNRNM
jgi:hypothetical protein